MKQLFSLFIILVASLSFAQEIQWKTIEQAEKEMQAHPEKPLYIDVYTDWCGYCRKMDVSTYKNAAVVEKINKDYIPVKFNAEEKKDIKFMGHEFKFVSAGPSGINTLAYNLLQGQMSYPSVVILTKEGKITNILRGYLTPDEVLSEI
ncbi:DUF255 domain-containing protein [Ornithobacterium rhinotracheale]|uniref:DUF255 domain-containing protein n=1 Tax=Ornithobacterium rhinotracheale TaxID=28251 RepID=A0A3R5UYS8_ORNRH|nr:DUF255 domain-containing protein [Ornithobacterium rhinotracheale]QAR31634.1 DUF255 domain-containing protein [Ornithobacterium rhinotracheale]